MKNTINQIRLPFHTLSSLRLRIGWFINLRWIAIIGVLSAIPIGKAISNFNIAFEKLFFIVSILIILNIFYCFIYKYFPFKNFRQELTFTETQVIIDLIILSFFVHYIGGLDNPFFFLYIIHIVISGILFQKVLPYVNAVFAALLLTGWSLLEYFQVVDVYLLGNQKIAVNVMIMSLFAFYFLSFVTTYIITDFITRYRELKDLIDQKSEQLEETMKERDKIFRFTAHELKSPLTTLRSILGVVELLYSAEEQQPKITEMLKRAETRSDQVLYMVKDMIEITHYKEGKIEKQLDYLNFEKWLEVKVNSLRDYADDEQINLIIKPANRESKKIYLDPEAFEKIVINLVNNAIRYSGQGASVTVSPYFGLQRFGLSVRDTGIGIAKEDQDKIFDEFYRSKVAREKEKIGTGLGLPLVKQIILQLNGEILLTSKVGEGSNFEVKVPYMHPPEENI